MFFTKFHSLNNLVFFQAARDESTDVDEDRAKNDAEALYKAGEKKLGTDEAAFVRILCSRSYPQLRATFRAYHEVSSSSSAHEFSILS